MTNYSFLNIDMPGATSTSPNAINDLGQIAGSYTDSGGHVHGYVESAGQFTPIDVPGASATAVTGINNLGQIVGDYANQSGDHGFLDSFGHISTIDMPGTTATYLGGINDLGQIVGTARLPTSAFSIKQVAFIDSGGHFSTINVPGYPNQPYTGPGGTYISGEGINDRGQITIQVYTPPGSFGGNAFIDDHGTFTRIVPPGSILPPSVGGINNLGAATGTYHVAPPGGSGPVPALGFVDAQGSFSTVKAPGSADTYAAAINDFGQVVGTRDDGAGHSHAFLATPDVAKVDIGSVLGGV
ncbi:MAG TPA: hypothetical protein VFN46_08255, partial [Acetobacteraceae bacterium]|nr:hypothetical protein [Acetobacteraceae bacterium]